MDESHVEETTNNYQLSSWFAVAASTKDLGIAARALACVADVLSCVAGRQGGLRSGPAANRAWTEAFSLLESGNVVRGVEKLTEERGKWLNR